MMFVDPPVRHHEAPSHWIPLSRVFVDVPEVRVEFEESLIEIIEARFDHGTPISLDRNEGGWRLAVGGNSYQVTERASAGFPPSPPGHEKNEFREKLGWALADARKCGLARLASGITSGRYRCHGRRGAQDADFHHVAKDVWRRSDVRPLVGEATTEAGTPLFAVHIEPVPIAEAVSVPVVLPPEPSPETMLSEWFAAQIAASPYRRTIKTTDGKGSFTEKAEELKVPVRRRAAIKLAVYATFPLEVVKIWRKSGPPAGPL